MKASKHQKKVQVEKIFYHRGCILWIYALTAFLAIVPLHVNAALDSEIVLERFSAMTQDKLETLIRANAKNIKGGGAQVQFEFDQVQLACISDSRHDRMRIISPVASEAELTVEQYKILLAANFHLTLDARYATSNGVLYAAFIHPLSTLSETDFLAAIRQVSQLVKNFGSSYSSGGLVFGGE